MANRNNEDGDAMNTWKIRLIVIAIFVYPPLLSNARANNYDDYSAALQRNDYVEALEIARKIVKSGGPGMLSGIAVRITNSKDILIDNHFIALNALGNYCLNVGIEAWIEDEAEQYYKKAIKFAGDREEVQADIYFRMASLYFHCDRPGLAIPLISKALEIYESRHDTYNVIQTYIGWSKMYTDMGETLLSNRFDQKWLEIANKYFVLGRRPKDDIKWEGYYEALSEYAFESAKLLDPAALTGVWKRMEEINSRYRIVNQPSLYFQGAKIFALAGQRDVALELLEKADDGSRLLLGSGPQPNEAEGRSQFEKAFLAYSNCTRAEVNNALGEKDQALIHGRSCEESSISLGTKLDTETQILLGNIYEDGGDYDDALRYYDAAIESLEGVRSSFRISDRAAFFTNQLFQSPYWGAIRIYSQRYLQDASMENFHAIFQAKERIRARQFGELSGASTISQEALVEIQQGLGTDSAVVDYVLTDSEIVLTAFSQTKVISALIPYDRREFRQEILSIAQSLSIPNSDPVALADALLSISEQLLGPVIPIIVDKKEIVVISDGAISLIPFGLYSADSGSYEALVDTKSIRYAPALRFLIENPGRGEREPSGLFALGDPMYSNEPAIAGLRSAELEDVTRSAEYLAYFAPLPETRTEVESISKLFPNQANELLLGSSAIESRVKKSDLSGFGYIHFATHGILGGEVPGIGEPALVLGSEPDEDGFLKASEAEALSLNAQLTVLSACNTGSGEFVQGEGVMGLSRAFLIAGSESVLVSLWPVASEATEELMVLFYRNLQSGERPEIALRNAQRSLREKKPHPFFWAPFVLIGQNE